MDNPVEQTPQQNSPIGVTATAPIHARQPNKTSAIVGFVVIVFVIVAGFLYWSSSMTNNAAKSFQDPSLTPSERKEKIIERVATPDTNPLTDSEAIYILRFVASPEGRAFKYSPEEEQNLIKALNN